MKKFTPVWFLLVLSFSTFLPAQQPDTLIQSLINETNLDSLTYYVRVLSGEDSVTINGNRRLITSRYVSNPGNDVAADFIYQTLEVFGLPTYNQPYSSSGRNVYAIQTGTLYPDQQFIICAHYDDMPSFSLAPGADDNASGTAAVLEAARILSNVATPYTVIYALWDEEEIGLVGSGYYAQQAFQAGHNIQGVINLEMFGWDGNDDGQYEIHTRPIANSVQLANLISFLENLYQISLTTTIQNPGTTASDHASFWNRGYSAIVFSQAFFSGDSNPYYHTSNDRIAHFNLGFFFALSRLAVATIAHLALHNAVLQIDPQPDVLASQIILEQNYPNPFNPRTTIDFELPDVRYTTLKIYNGLGEEIETLVAQNLAAGLHSYRWDAREQTSGIYFYRLTAGSDVEMKKMVLVK